MTDTTFEEFDDWTSKVFTERERNQLQQHARKIIETYEAQFPEETDEDLYREVEFWFQINKAKILVEWLRSVHEADEAPKEVHEMLGALGCGIGCVYLLDSDWEHDEEMTDHALYFGAAEWLEENLGDTDDDDE